LFLLKLHQHVLWQFGGGGVERGVMIFGFGIEFDCFLGGALIVEAFVVASLHEPFRQGAMFAKAGQLGEQVDADGLKDIGGILVHAKLDGDGVDKILVFVDEGRPGFGIALQAAGDQLLIGGFVAAPLIGHSSHG
jgi:hypothetical protein